MALGVWLWVIWRGRARALGKAAAILDAATDGMITIDAKGVVGTFNRAAEGIFGYGASEVIGRNIKMLMPDPYHSDHDGYLAAYKATGRPKIIGSGREVTGLRKDGSTFPMDLAVGESRQGQQRLFAGIVRDITARKVAEQRLRDSEAQTRTILETAADGIITLDSNGTMLTANVAAEGMFGYRAPELVGQNVTMLIPEAYQSGYEEFSAGHRAGGLPKITALCREAEGRHRSGAIFPLEFSVGEADVGGRRVFTAIVRDVSNRKKSEEDLRHSEERFRLIIDNVRDYAIAWLDLDGRIVSWNEGGGRIYGWSADEIIGKHTDMLYPPELRAESTLSLLEVREKGRYEGEGWRSRRDGSRFWAHAVITPLWDAKGALRGFVHVSHDITGRKRVEEGMQAAKEEAERAREEADRAREEADRAKEEAERAKEEAYRAKDEAVQAREEAEQAREEADRAREEADRAREEADRAREEADRANIAKSKFLAAASHDEPVRNSVFGVTTSAGWKETADAPPQSPVRPRCTPGPTSGWH